MDPYAGRMYSGNTHLQNQPQIVTNHYGSLHYPKNRVVYGGNSTTYDNPYNSDPEWQYPNVHHTLKATSNGRYTTHNPHSNNYLSDSGAPNLNGSPNPYAQQTFPENIQSNPNAYHHQAYQNNPSRLPLNISNPYNERIVTGSSNHPDVAVNGPNNLTIAHTNYYGHQTTANVGGTIPRPDGQHAVVRQLQAKFGGSSGPVDAGSDVTAEENYGCEPDSAQNRNNHIPVHNYIGNSTGVSGGDSNHLNHSQQNHNSSNGSHGGGGAGGPGLNSVIPNLCCASEKDVLDQNRLDEGSEDENSLCLRSLWVHCRLSVLLVLVVILLILFLSFSGALLYFKSKLNFFLCTFSLIFSYYYK